MFSGKLLMRCCDYVGQEMSMSSNMTKVTLQFRRANDSKCAIILRCVQMSRCFFVYVIDYMFILTFFLNADTDAVFLAFSGVCH